MNINILENSQEIFQNAIKEGILSANENDKIYAGNFMYMYSQDGTHYFKHRLTRKYGYNKETILNTCNL